MGSPQRFVRKWIIFPTTQVASRSKVIVLGPTVRDDLFGAGSDPIGERIRVNTLDFTIIGITKGKKADPGFASQSDMKASPITSMRSFLSGGQYVSTISIQAKGQASMTDVQQNVTGAPHGPPPHSVAGTRGLQRAESIGFSSAASNVTDTFTMLLASIAGISLLVGGIGIMNAMLTTVTERTRGIGLRQAIGARKKEIVLRFSRRGDSPYSLGRTGRHLPGFRLVKGIGVQPCKCRLFSRGRPLFLP